MEVDLVSGGRLLVAPVISDPGGAPGCAMHHLPASLIASMPVAFVFVGGIVQGRNSDVRRRKWCLAGWTAFRRNPDAY